MRRILVTGGAGFIGSAVVRHIIDGTSDSVVVVDKLTYAGNLESLTVVAHSERYAFEQVDIELVYAGRTLGLSESKIFWRVVLPSAGPGVVSGTILTFARALGEYGATSMLAGNIAGKTGTISQRIAMVIQNGDYLTAGLWVAIILLISFGIVVLMNLFADSKMKNIKKW